MFTYEEANAYIAEIPKFTSKNKASNTEELLRRLGHPEKSFPVIHVAGTNGKGSVCAFLAGMLQETGLRTGLFTSPHLVRINERFQINRREVSDALFTEVFSEVKQTVESMLPDGFFHPTYFEFLFAMGMVIFARKKAEVVVMETGLGGRLDATNTVAHPVCCIITSISLDHTEYLGDTIPLIAAEKAGIIKEGVPLVYDGSDPEAAAVIKKRAEEMHAPAYAVLPSMLQITGRSDKGIAFVVKNRYYDFVPVRVPFPADYQAMNATVAMTAFRVITDPENTGNQIPVLTDEGICRAVLKVRWPGRMEEILPGVFIDGAHNADGIANFLQAARFLGRTGGVSLLFAAVSDKDYPEMIRRICQGMEFSSVVVTRIGESRKVSQEVLASVFRQYTSAPVYAVPDPGEAFDLALSLKKKGILLCTGSLYLVGEIEGRLKGTCPETD